MRDYYKILGISEEATAEQIKAAYRSLALQWHPDRNPGKDTTERMKEINEAYTILSNPDSRYRYDKEYSSFKRTCSAAESASAEDYDIKDEDLKQEVKKARKTAEEFVKNFYASFKSDTKTAYRGALEAAKPYVILAVVLTIIGLFVLIFSSEDIYTSYQVDYAEPQTIAPSSVAVRDVKPIPNDWKTYEFATAFRISVPPTVELRSDDDDYTKTINRIGLNVNTNNVVFQPLGLSRQNPDAQKKYCRIIIEYLQGKEGDFMRSSEVETLDSEWKSLLQEMVIGSIGPFSNQLGTTQYKWVTINGSKAIQLDYKRTGYNFDESIPVICRMGIFQNNNEMVRIILSYRENEANIWAEDFKNVFETIEWI